MSERWQQIERYYHAALEHPKDERKGFLERECADLELRKEVATLLDQGGTEIGTGGLTSYLSSETVTEYPANLLGPYRIEAPLGAGGMGEVFRAVDTRLGRTVALKILTQDKMTNPAFKRRFLQEARAASALNHPNIVVLYDLSSQGDTDFLVMEYVAGKTLREMIPGGGLPFAQVAALGSQIASALGAAHRAGIVHRDVKPANIMVTPDQQVKVLDFGIAKLMLDGKDAGLTMAGSVMGTVAYMSPEQTRGDELDGRSDIFSLGCVLYQAATGKAPFGGASMLATMHEIATLDPAPPSSLCPELPAAFDFLVARCLAKQPGARPETAAEVATELRSISLPEPATARIQPNRISVAVPPFQMRGSADSDFLSVSLADGVIHRLSANGGMVVRPIASVMRYAGKPVEWTQVARDLNVNVVVEGTIQVLGSKVRVLVQAHRAADSQTIASAKQDGDMGDLFALQDRVADLVCEFFFVRQKGTGEQAAPPTTNALAFELYLRAIDRQVHMDKYEMASAIEMLTQATGLDPGFANAWGLLAQAYTQMGAHLDPDPKWFTLGEQAIAKTLELDPVQCDALCARGIILWSPSRQFQNRAALRAINAALKMNPMSPNARQQRAAILWHLGFLEAAAIDAEELAVVIPSSALSGIHMGFIFLQKGDFEKAATSVDRALKLEPTNVLAHLNASIPPLWAGKLTEARQKIQRARSMFPQETFVTAVEAILEAAEGNFAQAERMADEAVGSQRSMTHTHHTWHYAAGTYALCGKPEKALAELRRCQGMGLPNYKLFLRDPYLRPLQGNPEFQSLITELRREHDAISTEFALETSTGPS